MKGMVQQFIEALKQDNSGVEAVVLATKDEILLEHYFTRLVSRNIYSHTKSYMSTAVGIAIDEGKMKLTDRLFPGIFAQRTSAGIRRDYFERSSYHVQWF